jgi:hypothetical protein
MKRLILSSIAVCAVLLPLSQKAEARWYYRYGYCHRYWHHGFWYAGWWHPGYWSYYAGPTIIIED